MVSARLKDRFMKVFIFEDTRDLLGELGHSRPLGTNVNRSFQTGTVHL